jgi:hypothetical protein
MTRRRSKARITATEGREEYLRRAEELWDQFNAWYTEHPDATFDEMEAELGRQRRALLGGILELSLRQRDLGATPEAPECEECGQGMVLKGYPRKTVHGLEVDLEIRRAYYVCPTCGGGHFPPGPAVASAERSLERGAGLGDGPVGDDPALV